MYTSDIVNATKSLNLVNSSVSQISDSSEILDSAVPIHASQVLNSSKSVDISDSVDSCQANSSEVSGATDSLDPSEIVKIPNSPKSNSTDTSKMLSSFVEAYSSEILDSS